ncbi:MAG: beta-mannosidase [Chitinophagaceae bacterium]|nr:beta-mannosidase [Chitinophagaceae bacterium]
MKSISLTLFLSFSSWSFCSVKAQLIDEQATKETKALYKNLRELSGKKIMFGHQDDLAYGVNWKYESDRSDIKEVVKDYPAVFGWDIGGIEHGNKENLDHVPFDKMIALIKKGYALGGVNTISWHVDNPVSSGNSWDTTRAVPDILPGGKYHDKFKTWLDKVATFLNELTTDNGVKIPILFRPFHELNGGWFWWGRTYCTPDEYKSLWTFVVKYLKDEKHIHHLIYVYNTNSFKTRDEFMERYPGNDLADMLSLDIYQRAPLGASEDVLANSSEKFKIQLQDNLKIMTDESRINNKLSALSETGFEIIPVSNWWTNVLYNSIKDYPISYVLVWRNHGYMAEKNKMHYFAPFKGHKSSKDFKRFYKKSKMIFRKKAKKLNLYQ